MKIGFIGCGNMGSAMISGILKKGIFQKDEIIVSNLTEEGSKRSREKLGVVTTLDNRQVVKNAKTIVLAVKPQFYQEVIEEVWADLTPEHMVIGVAAGKSLDWIQEICQTSLKVARLMPNTPAQVGEGMTGVCRNELVTDDDLEQVLKITDSFGKTQVVPERLMDAVGAVSGCSPAYVFIFIEAMADAAVAQGLSLIHISTISVALMSIMQFHLAIRPHKMAGGKRDLEWIFSVLFLTDLVTEILLQRIWAL